MFDCLSDQESKIKYFTDSNRVKRIEKYSFIWERLGDVHLFRILGLGLSRFFVSDELKNHIQLNKLTGLLFEPVPIMEEDENKKENRKRI